MTSPKARQTYLIKKDDLTFYVPRPQSWMYGLARHHWIKKNSNIDVHIASPTFWTQLQKIYPTYLLIENESGEVEWHLTDSSQENEQV